MYSRHNVERRERKKRVVIVNITLDYTTEILRSKIMKLFSFIFTFQLALICTPYILPADARQKQSALSLEELSKFATSVSLNALKFTIIITYIKLWHIVNLV